MKSSEIQSLPESSNLVNPLEDLYTLRDKHLVAYDELKEKVDKDIEIDSFDLDGESLRTPKLYAKYLQIHSDEAQTLFKLSQLRDRVYLERWKAYNGKQTKKYYADNGTINETILKGDVEKYLLGDEKMCIVSEIVEIQKSKVGYLEKVLKEISNRGFHIKTAVEWRKFQSGS